MRVTNRMMAGSLTRYIQNGMGNLARTQEKISTSKSILRPSDEPRYVSQLMTVKASIQANQQYTRNIDDGLSYLNMTDTALGTLGEVVSKAKGYALQAANGTMTLEDRGAIGAQIDKMINQVIDLGNSTIGGKYIFAGQQNDSPPFARTGDIVSYAGNGQEETAAQIAEGIRNGVFREIGEKANYKVDTRAVSTVADSESVFGVLNPLTGEVTGGLFKTLLDLRDAANAGDQVGINDALGSLDIDLDRVLKFRVGVGARTNHFEAVKDQIFNQEIRMTEVMENLEGADIARLSIEMAQQQLTYQASLATGSTIMKTTLLDYLR